MRWRYNHYFLYVFKYIFFFKYMCGITLYLSKEDTQNAISQVLASLYELQKRGYDSFGIAYYDTKNKMFQRLVQ